MIVLHADDDDEDREIFSEAFRMVKPSIIYVGVKTGKEALERLIDTTNLPDHIFLDSMMPVMTGNECLKAIKQNSALRTIPVIMCSNHFTSRAIAELKELGANQILRKPSTFDDLVKVLAALVNDV
jgi:CheY-like chemotaxis protein